MSKQKPIAAMSRMTALASRVEPPKVTAGREAEIPLNKIVFDKTQPRSDFHHADGQVAPEAQLTLEELADSIRANDLISPITVESIGDGTYRVLVGERRTRAHLLIGKTTIRAIINDSLADADPKKRLLYQMAENVNRDDLSEMDMASKIRLLMDGQEGSPALTQTQIAKELGKSEGWVSRYVRYGDEEMQRLWLKTGIADSVENLYRLSVLPKAVQVDIQRRVALDSKDPEYMPVPLSRTVIDGFSKEAKQAKKSARLIDAKAASEGAAAGPVMAPTPQTQHLSQSGLTDEAQSPSLLQSDKDGISQRLTEMAADGQQAAEQRASVSTPPVISDTGEGYKLSAQGRADILGKAQVAISDSSSVQPPVNVRTQMASLQTLLASLDEEMVKDLKSVPLSLTLPGPLAQRIANALAGMIVEPTEVPSVVQNEMAKL